MNVVATATAIMNLVAEVAVPLFQGWMKILSFELTMTALRVLAGAAS